MTKGIPDPILAANRREIVRRIVEQSIKWNWPPAFTSEVVVAQLARVRVYVGVFGPCAYCGDWVANSVDHVMPWSRGGSEDDDNLVSACGACNFQKRDRTPAEWLEGMNRAEYDRRRWMEDLLFHGYGPRQSELQEPFYPADWAAQVEAFYA